MINSQSQTVFMICVSKHYVMFDTEILLLLCHRWQTFYYYDFLATYKGALTKNFSKKHYVIFLYAYYELSLGLRIYQTAKIYNYYVSWIKDKECNYVNHKIFM